jgi:protein-disulfide isomerase
MVKAQAEKLGLDWGRMQADMAAPGVSQRLDGNIALARRLGIEGTPAMVIGGRLIPGAVDLAELKEAVAAARKG